MALPSDPADTFVREVDENLRRDQLRDMAQAYGKWIVLAVVLFLAAVGGYLYWQSRQQAQSSAESEAMAAAFDKADSGNANAAAAELAAIADSSNDVNRASARLAQAALALRRNDRKTATDIYREMAADSGLPQPYRDVATLRGTMTEYDSLKPEEVIARLTPLAEPGKPFFGSAGELVALAKLAKGDRAGAGQLFAKIAADPQVPPTLRSRAVQIAGSLGVDATASLPGMPGNIPAQ